ncbi:MAG: tRNA (guanine-N(1)-)-methyltransferase [Candidatus Magasanikbacteria bacterium GW2011_GWC2_41_17]|uniref:tRNA (guanine-N(1)-)-methyltransferase n=2 Tax=Candidatus Magasanikiibacteriota TaxID=1752731 RepID=A0A0G0WKN4_9BACT|nr:MAG: tRNA (guanine-N(1)-)-methyltransferase [Candidatus Magasanikbacteria bacterium GW2011_GWC2_41_17]KKS13405.1 MAG: tRNA (guanine-N(1)-)-methyltransferase [Candidatus Magasanikbacteria bacterium GW2011_GWA2_41_55]
MVHLYHDFCLLMRFEILTIFPQIIEQYSNESILKRGQATGAIKIIAHDFRKFANDKHNKVDDTPYGGGPGMVLKAEPIFNCLKSLGLIKGKLKNKNSKTKIIILDPAGKRFDQKMARRFSKLERLILICGRYEGFDERVYKFVDEKISIGDYVLSGGELPALVVAESVARLVSGVVGNAESLKEETFEGFVEYPQYTRPEDFMGAKVPKVLLSGNHKKIEEWRKKHSCG